jgi:hypothetical protein
MIAQTLRQIRGFGGSMIVASTGLGKTVVAVHVALHLREEDVIDNVMIVGPKAVCNSWQWEMLEAGISCRYFVRQTFDQKDSKRNHSLQSFEEILEKIQQQRWLLIIDESHDFRNRFKKDLFNLKKDPKERLSFIRLREFVKKGNQKVLLLTGSPYARDIENINNQLYLLPHTAEHNTHELDCFLDNLPECKHLFTEETKDRNAWRVETPDEFIHLPVVSQLTTPHVAKYYGQEYNKETYINFGNEKRYVPNVTLHTVTFSLILETELIEAITKGCFNINNKNPMFKELFNSLVKVAWASSPLALQDTLVSIADTPGGENSYKLGKLDFTNSRQDREKILKPIIAQIKKLSSDHNNDMKLRGTGSV